MFDLWDINSQFGEEKSELRDMNDSVKESLNCEI